MKRLKRKKTEFKTVAYLRVSTNDQETEKDKADILKLANDKDFGKVVFIAEKISGKIAWKERKIFGIIEGLGQGDRLIVPELSRLGRSMLEIMEILSIAKQKEVAIYDVRNGWELNGTIQSKVLAMAFSIAAEIERDLISKRTKAGLAAAKAQGKQLGRPKGPGKSKLDPYREEIIALLKNGSSKKFVANRYNCSQVNLYNWISKNQIDAKPDLRPVRRPGE